MLWFVLAVLMAGWWGGLKPGLVATALGALGGIVFLFEGAGIPGHQPGNPVPVVLFVVVGGMISWLCEAGHRSRRHLLARLQTLQESNELLLGQMERRHHSLIAALSEMVWRTGPHGETVEPSPRWKELTGQTMQSSSGEGWLEAVHPDDRAGTRERWHKALATLQPYETEYRIRRPDGSWRHMLARGLPVLDEAGQVQEWVGVLLDITERKQAEQAVRDAQQMLETVLNNIPQGVFWKDRHSRYLGCNAVVRRAFGLERAEQVLDLTDWDLPGLSRDQAAFFIQKDREVMELGEPVYGIIEQATLADGSTIWMETNKMPLRDAQGQVIGILGTWQDITERKKLEEQLRQSQKMDAVGQLAGGVAHDFNNLLTVINGLTDMLLFTMPAGHAMRHDLEQIRSAGERAAGLTGQLLAFSRQTMMEVKVLDLNTVVGESEKMLRRVIGEDIELTVLPAPALSRVKVDPGQIGQVLLNLALNARDAMPRGGRLTIETSNTELDDAFAKLWPDARPGRYVLLAVSDTGCGMTPEIKARIFEPFYTTKGPGKGTGLGLAVVHGIVKQSGGHIEAYSEPGHGSTFKAYLPAIAEENSSPKGPDKGRMAKGGTETVLLVEDEDAVRRISETALRSNGYQVLTAASGPEALRMAASYRGDIALLVTDVVMPGMSGRQLADALRSQYPKLPVLFMSGYTSDAVLRHGVLGGEENFLQKPFTLLSLANKVREVLDKQ